MARSQQPTAGRRDSRSGGEPARNPLPHLTACLAITAVSVLVTLALHLLT